MGVTMRSKRNPIQVPKAGGVSSAKCIPVPSTATAEAESGPSNLIPHQQRERERPDIAQTERCDIVSRLAPDPRLSPPPTHLFFLTIKSNYFHFTYGETETQRNEAHVQLPPLTQVHLECKLLPTPTECHHRWNQQMGRWLVSGCTISTCRWRNRGPCGK